MLNPLDPTTLEAARDKAKLSRSELAELSGVAETTILRIEHGKVDPKLRSTWSKIVVALQAASKPRRAKAA